MSILLILNILRWINFRVNYILRISHILAYTKQRNIIRTTYYKINHPRDLMPARYIFMCHSWKLIHIKNQEKYLKNG